MCEISTMKNLSRTFPNRYILTSATISNRIKSDLKRERFSQYLCCCIFPEGAFILPFKRKFVFKPVAKGAAARISSKPTASARAKVAGSRSRRVGRPPAEAPSYLERAGLGEAHGLPRRGPGRLRAIRRRRHALGFYGQVGGAAPHGGRCFPNG
uniref:uncharacterized protein LOC118147804 n=1 Tax=Callithrix jacchus TaxID=9483 RepID=UPI0023DD3BF2|nr:uncharacterized protein LOC118147804 [Callithrix jacchus]